MNEKTLVSAFTLLFSLFGYFSAKILSHDVVPFVMVCGFIGAMIGERIYEFFNDNNNTPGTA